MLAESLTAALLIKAIFSTLILSTAIYYAAATIGLGLIRNTKLGSPLRLFGSFFRKPKEFEKKQVNKKRRKRRFKASLTLGGFTSAALTYAASQGYFIQPYKEQPNENVTRYGVRVGNKTEPVFSLPLLPFVTGEVRLVDRELLNTGVRIYHQDLSQTRPYFDVSPIAKEAVDESVNELSEGAKQDLKRFKNIAEQLHEEAQEIIDQGPQSSRGRHRLSAPLVLKAASQRNRA